MSDSIIYVQEVIKKHPTPEELGKRIDADDIERQKILAIYTEITNIQWKENMQISIDYIADNINHILNALIDRINKPLD